jgi:hypothetical protein
MKYLIADMKTEEKVLCDNDREATELIEEKLRANSAEADIQVFAVERVNFQVARLPVVSFDQSEQVEPAETPEPAPSADSGFTSRLSDLTSESGSSAPANPFMSEEIFSLDA